MKRNLLLLAVVVLASVVSSFAGSYRWVYCMRNGIPLVDSNTVTLTQRCKVAVSIKCARWLDSTDNSDTYSGSGFVFTTEQMTEWCLRGNLNPDATFGRMEDYFWTANSVDVYGYDITDAQINFIIHRKFPVFAKLIGTGSL